MQSRNPKPATVEEKEKRIAVPQPLVPDWLRNTDDQAQVFCIPLLWVRAIPIPPGHELDAWYVWSATDPRTDWVTNPNAVLDAEDDGTAFYLKNMMHIVTVTAGNRQCKISCAGLFGYLVERSGSKLWLTHERHSIGILTDFAYHTVYGRLKLE